MASVVRTEQPVDDNIESKYSMKAAILYSTFFDPHGTERKVGGIETYLLTLAGVFLEMGIKPTIYQWSKQPFSKQTEGISVKGIPLMHYHYKRRSSLLLRSVLKEIDAADDIMIFGSDQQAVRSGCKRAVSIQHGIAWDLPNRFLTSHAFLQSGLFGNLYKRWLQKRFRGFYERCPNRVCVDYNFLNWYRTQLATEPEGRNWVIPNFASIASGAQIKSRARNDKTIRILFARRFCEFRGTRIMAQAARSILEKYSNIEFTFAGEGPDEQWLKEYFVDDSRVAFLRYLPDESLEINLKHDIAVVPSLASEGTSLSVAEAMGAGCAVVGTAIGGITNMIIDGYNGLLISPTVLELTSALVRLIESPELRKDLGANAFQVAEQGFSLSIWQARWRAVIESMVELE